jgi:hypothetical protein
MARTDCGRAFPLQATHRNLDLDQGLLVLTFEFVVVVTARENTRDALPVLRPRQQL